MSYETYPARTVLKVVFIAFFVAATPVIICLPSWFLGGEIDWEGRHREEMKAAIVAETKVLRAEISRHIVEVGELPPSDFISGDRLEMSFGTMRYEIWEGRRRRAASVVLTIGDYSRDGCVFFWQASVETPDGFWWVDG